MNDGFFDIVELVSKYMTGELTGAERENLDNWLSLSEDNRKWFHEVTEKEFIYRKRQELRSIDVKGGWKALSRKRAKENRRRLGIRALKYACVFILLVVSSMYFFNRSGAQLMNGFSEFSISEFAAEPETTAARTICGSL